ncbi:MAG: peptide deformylase [Sulfuricurvum sp.]
MIQPLLKYPDSRIRLISANVRFFNDELHEWITDIIDTMKANDLDALSAIMIGIQYNIIVIKNADTYTPYVNARLIKCTGNSTQTERSIYYDAISVDVDRYENVTVIYEDENGESHHCDLTGEAARTFQHQLDYSFGSTFVDRVDKEMKQRINDHLEFGLIANGSTCPMVFVRDYFKRGAKYVMGLILVSFILPFFVSPEIRTMTYTADIYLLIAVPVLMVAYFFYALYESRLYKQCTSCQIGNIIGTTAIMSVQLIIVALGVFFWVKP